MPRFILYFIVLFLACHHVSFSQKKAAPKKDVKPAVKKHNKTTNLGIGLGLTRSVVYLARNVKPGNDATGLNLSLVYGGSKLFRVSFEYTRYAEIDIAPTWYDINAGTIELNTHILARFKNDKAFFYPLFGVSYNTFAGTYTGINDFLNLDRLYKKDERVFTRWLGVNLGVGYEYYFKMIGVFLGYKMRIGLTEGHNQINIQDVCITAGLKFDMKVPSLYRIFVRDGTRSRYLLDK